MGDMGASGPSARPDKRKMDYKVRHASAPDSERAEQIRAGGGGRVCAGAAAMV